MLNKTKLLNRRKHWNNVNSLNIKLNNVVNQYAFIPLNYSLFEILKSLLMLVLWLPSLIFFIIWLQVEVITDKLVKIYHNKLFGIRQPENLKSFKRLPLIKKLILNHSKKRN